MKKIYLSDTSNIEKDSFKVHTKISETLYEIIEKHEVENESFTIGLFGEWGSGKSYIINKLSKLVSVEKEKNITLLYIDVWKYSGFPLLRSILFDLNNQLKDLSKNEKYDSFKNGFRNSSGKGLDDILYCDEVFESKSEINFEEYVLALKKLLRRYKRPFFLTMILFAFFVIYHFIPSEILKYDFLIKIKGIFQAFFPFFAFIGGVGIFLPLLQKPLQELGQLIFFRNTIKNFTEKANFSPEQFEKTFKEMLNKLEKEKFVIVFDNLDRCEPLLAYETLSTIKTFMDVKNCFYIIPCDDDAIKNFLSKGDTVEHSFQRKFAEEFIDKIFQTYLRIPHLKEIERDAYINEQIEQIDFNNELQKEDIEVITEILYFAYKGESPRNIKRFINDYSTYFRFANLSHPVLLENITLFSIIIAIKQKWYTFEKILIDNPTFFKEFISNNNVIDEHKNVIKEFETLKVFLNNIKFYIRGFSNISISEYIHFKESEDTIEIVEKLRSSNNIKTEINSENLKVLRKEFLKNSQSNKAFAINSYISWAYLIINNTESSFLKILIADFWKNLSESQIDYSILTLGLKDEEILSDIIVTLESNNVTQIRQIVEKNICDIFKAPLTQIDMALDLKSEYDVAFKQLITSKYQFNEKNIHKLFEKWDLENLYLNELLKHINSSKNKKYLPTIVLQRLNNTITTQTIEIYKYWGYNSIPINYGKQLFSELNKRLATRAVSISNPQLLIQQWSEIELDFDLMSIQNSSFIVDTIISPFTVSLNTIIQRIFQFSNSNEEYNNKAISFWIESIYFSSKNIDLFDKFLTNQFNSNFQTQERLTYLIDNIKYENQILNLPELKLAIYKLSPDLQKKILSKIDVKYHTNFELLFSSQITLSDIQTIKSNIIDKSESKELVKDFVKYILTRILKDTLETPVSIVDKIIEIDKLLPLDGNKTILKDNKNRFIDLYKMNPSIGIKLFSFLEKHLTATDLKKLYIIPLIKFISSELENTKAVSKYENIAEFVSIEVGDDTLSADCIRIIEGCLAKNQEINENYLGLNLFLNTLDTMDDASKKIIIELINNNDNLNDWSQTIKEKLDEKNFIKKVVSDLIIND